MIGPVRKTDHRECPPDRATDWRILEPIGCPAVLGAPVYQ